MNWIPVQGCDLAFLEDRLNLPYRIEGLEAHVYVPGYYRQGGLLRLRAPDYHTTFIIAGEGRIFERQLFPLDGNSAPIHAGNEAAMIDIRTVDQAEEYLRFFCEFLRSHAGHKFRIVEGLNTGWCVPGLDEFDPPPLAMQADGEGHFQARSVIEYDRVLFEAEFAIHSDGMVAMLDDDPIGPLVPRDPH